MVRADDLWKYLKSNNYTFFSGVPCTILKEALEAGRKCPWLTYIPAVRENAALGVASGAFLAGKRSGILMQNSGLGNIINALTSFNLMYKIPVLMFITWRGFQGKDAPEHLLMGDKTLILLKDLGIPYRVLGEAYKKDIDWAVKAMNEKSLPAAIIVKEGQIK